MDDDTDRDSEFKLDDTDCVNCKKLPLSNKTLPLVKINSFAIEPLNVYILPLIDELTLFIFIFVDELFDVTVPLIEDDTAVNAANDCDKDALIKRVVLDVFVPPVKFNDCVTATGT